MLPSRLLSRLLASWPLPASPPCSSKPFARMTWTRLSCFSTRTLRQIPAWTRNLGFDVRIHPRFSSNSNLTRHDCDGHILGKWDGKMRCGT
ncbi:hypothetical protein CH063_04876 [Colletotrichum higginsianum]|uniref:Uncharacterized protein n=1 Tax=Colletotrichum higginsianum (strain IMI 349063) TaxID=759273 RepID=H1UWY5_COLHI|nr:hypothetical protein CH063_04876 [Colletotrichum higginsianum]